MNCRQGLVSLLLALMFLSTAGAEIRLPKVIGSHMVLQRASTVRIWGWAEAGEPVTVGCDWLDRIQRTKADDQGRWQVELPTGQAGGPHSITLSGKNQIRLEDILFGEVWLASGQSNMEMPLIRVSGAYTGIKDAEQEVAAADHPQIRLFQAGNFSSQQPLEDVEAGITMYGIPPAACQWQVCSPETVPTFSSTAYFFARELQRTLEVPIGIIDSSWGGTSAEVWTPASGLEKLGYSSQLEEARSAPQQPDKKIPARLYNGMIHPLRHFKIKGVIWYQGEGNARAAAKYSALFSTMIGEWRTAFGEEFSFYFAQISPFNYGFNSAPLREAQLKVSQTVPGTGMAVTMDIGNLKDIHPKNKQEVGRRLALWALARDYARDVVSSGPVFKSAQFADGQARVHFDQVVGGLSTTDQKNPSHFELAGPDKEFYPASARIDGDVVVVTSEKVAEPVAVRYAFSSTATPNLTNKEGLPASSFRSDTW